MYKIFILFLFSLPLVLAAQTVENTSRLVKMEELMYDFGRIPQGKPVSHLFKITNISDAEIKINQVQASCGCTTPEWSVDVIQPGTSSLIKVGFNAEALGVFEKSISIQLSKGSNEVLMIKGNVWKTPEQPAPFNRGLRVLRGNNISENH